MPGVHPHPPTRALPPRGLARAAAAALGVLAAALVVLLTWSPVAARAATSLDVGGCSSTGALSFGSMVGAFSAVTATDCRIGFGSDEGTAQLRLSQADRSGRAMWAPSDGALDAGFDGADGTAVLAPGSIRSFSDVVVQPDGMVVAVGTTGSDVLVARYRTDGTLDPAFDGPSGTGDGQFSFDMGWGANDTAMSVALQADGRIVLGGQTDCATACRPSVARLNVDGSLDTTFGGSGAFVISARPNADIQKLAVDYKGRIAFVGCDKRYGSPCQALVGRLRADGSLDRSFGGTGWVVDDVSFAITGSTGAWSAYQGIAVDRRGRVYGGGYASSVSEVQAVVVRYREDGVRDTSWDGDGITYSGAPATTNERAQDVAIDAQGRLVVAADGNRGARTTWLVQRFTTTGALDTTFHGDGHAELAPGTGAGYLEEVVTTPDGAVYAVGTVDSDLGAAQRAAVWSLGADGEPRTRFGTAGLLTLAPIGTGWETLAGVALAADGAVVAAGEGRVAGVTSTRVTRLAAAGAVPDYQDGVADWNDGAAAFGACLRTTVGPVTANWPTTGACAASDSTSWNDVPASGLDAAGGTVATTSAAGTDGIAGLRFGARNDGTLATGNYTAQLSVDVIAPSIVAPSNTVLPTITGSAQERRPQVASTGTWSGSAPMTYTYQWRRCNAAGASCADVSGATRSRYSPTTTDIGSTLRVVVTATNSEGSASATSAQTGVIAAWAPTITYNSGFEHGWASGGAPNANGDLFQSSTAQETFDTNVSRNGTRSLRIETPSANVLDTEIRPYPAGSPAGPVVVARFYVRFDQLPTTSEYVFEMADVTGTDYVMLKLAPSGQLSLETAPVFTTIAGANVEAGRWYRIDMRANATANPWVSDWSVDGVAQPQLVTARAATTFDHLQLGGDYASQMIAYLDDLAVSQTSADYPLPAGQDLIYTTDQVGNHNPTGTPPIGQSTNNFATCPALVAGEDGNVAGTNLLVDDVPPVTGGGADGVCLNNTGGTYAAYRFADHVATAGPPNAVMVGAAVVDDGSGANDVVLTASSAGTAAVLTDNPTATLRYRATALATKPSGGAWDNGNFDTLSLRLSSTDVVPQPRVHSIYAEVDHDSGPTAAAISPPVVTGLNKVGATLTTTNGVWTDPTATFGRQWMRCTVTGVETCTDIPAATGTTYVLTGADLGLRIRVVVTATTAAGRQSQRSAATTAIGAAAPTLVRLDGFEHNTVSTLGGGIFSAVNQGSAPEAPTVTSLVARTGDSALMTDTTAGYSNVHVAPPSATGVMVVRVAVMFDALPTTRSEVLTFGTSGGNSCRVWYEPATNKLNTRFTTAGASGQYSTQTIVPWRWYQLDVRCDTTSNPKLLDMAVDGVPVAQASIAEAAQTVTDVSLGQENGDFVSDAVQYYDDFAMSQTAANYPIGWGQVQAVRPEGTNTITTPGNFRWTTTGSTTCSTGVGYTNFVAGDAARSHERSDYVDEWPVAAGGSADRWCQRAATGSIEVTLEEDTEAVAPTAVQFLGAHAAQSAAGNTLSVEYSDTSGTWASAYNTATITPNTTTEYHSAVKNLRSNGGAWSVAQLNASKFRIGATAISSGAFTESLLAQYETPTGTPLLPVTPPRIVLPYSVPKVGDELLVDDAVWTDASGPVDRRWRWQRCDATGAACAFIAGATGSTYTLQAGDVGSTIRVIESADDGDGAQVQQSATATQRVSTAPTSPMIATGFEHGLYAASVPLGTSGVTPTVSTSVARTGDASLFMNPSGGQSTVQWAVVGTPASQVLRVYFRMDAFPTGNPGIIQNILAIRNSSNQDGVNLGLTDAGQLFASTQYSNAGLCTQTTGFQLQANRWYLLDLAGTTATTNMVARWAVDGIEQAPPAPCTNASITSTSFENVQLGPMGIHTGTWRYDDLLVTSTATDFPLGGGRTEALRPNVDGVHNNASAFVDESGTGLGVVWSRLDELVMGSTADNVRQTTADASAYLETAFSDPVSSSGSARFVQGTIQTRSLATNPNTFTWKTLPGTTVEAGATTAFTGNIGGTGTTPVYRRFVLPTPGPGWTFAQLTGLRYHTGYSNDVNPVPVLDAAIAEVEYRE